VKSGRAFFVCFRCVLGSLPPLGAVKLLEVVQVIELQLDQALIEGQGAELRQGTPKRAGRVDLALKLSLLGRVRTEYLVFLAGVGLGPARRDA